MEKQIIEAIKKEIKKVIVAQDACIDDLLVALLADGHVLIEGVPGVAKTLLAKAMAKTMALDFNRIQFTPDLLPSDITGTKVYDFHEKQFNLMPGPVVTHVLLADEINRTPAKTQAGLLEAMTETSISVSGESIDLPSPYMVIATQNPLEFDGTYALPEALVDRFLVKVVMSYPERNDEIEVLKKHHKGELQPNNVVLNINSVCSKEDVLALQGLVKNIEVKEEVLAYMSDVVRQTRQHEAIDIGASPRGTIALLNASKAYAVLQRRTYVIPEDVKRMALPVLRHRVFIKPEVEIEGVLPDHIITDILSHVDVPR